MGDHELISRAAALAGRGQLDEAVAVLQKAARSSGSARILDALGELFLAGGRYDEAIEVYRKLTKLKYPGAFNGLGNALQCAGRLAEAVEAYGRAIRAKPDYVEAR